MCVNLKYHMIYLKFDANKAIDGAPPLRTDLALEDTMTGKYSPKFSSIDPEQDRFLQHDGTTRREIQIH